MAIEITKEQEWHWGSDHLDVFWQWYCVCVCVCVCVGGGCGFSRRMLHLISCVILGAVTLHTQT